MAGLSQEKISQCTDNEGLANAIIAQRMQGEKQYAINSTPTFVLKAGSDEKRINGALPYEEFDKALKSLSK